MWKFVIGSQKFIMACEAVEPHSCINGYRAQCIVGWYLKLPNFWTNLCAS